MKTDTREKGFEAFIQEELIGKNGYKKRSTKDYEKKLCIDHEAVLDFIMKTQGDAFTRLYGKGEVLTEDRFLKRLDEEITARGLLDVLRNGISDHGTRFDLAYFKPETGFNTETMLAYQSNSLSVMRQVKYSEKNENSLDMVIFLNGLPIFTVELKNQLTNQTVKNGIEQYKTDRDPKEKLFSFKRCLTHFAVDTELAYMTTHLTGLSTRFLPFNKGNNNSAGNPINPHGYKTAYMWEDIWTRDSILELIGRYMHLKKEEKEDSKGQKSIHEYLIFPRYHQLDTVRRLIADARDNGAGENYLIQHSAGSGKSNTIAWTAHHLAGLHGKDNKAIFDSIIVVTDRRVLDRQLRNTIMQFEQTAGVVKPIVEGSKELKTALESGEKIIVTTLQKFPVIVSTVGDLPGKKFAVIIDEAHSSQTGESSKSLKQVLAVSDLEEAEKLQEKEETGETLEDMIIKEIRSRRAKTANISFYAFTATPKQKTLEIFGNQSPLDGKFYPFSLYSMKQAIEERFILDVLKNYTTYQVYFALLKKIQEDPEFQRKKTQKLLLQYVERHEHAIEKKVGIMVEHFVKNIVNQINGEAKAMIVTKSRLHAVRYKKAVDKYLKEQGYSIKALVAFSGTVKDGGLEYTEAQINGVPERHTAEEFKKSENKFLIVAEKFQTGFDQPLLTVMYVDKKLGGVNAVQTLSRLNRTHHGKEEVFVLDFVNDSADIKESFQPYYTTTVLSEATDPNILHDLQRDILNFRIFSETEVGDFVADYFRGVKPAVINAFLDEIVKRFNTYLPEEQADFREKITNYVRKYAFISQIISFEDTALEKLYVFLRMLARKMPLNKEQLPLEVLETIDMESYKIVKNKQTQINLEDEEGLITPIEGSDRGKDVDEKDILSKIIKDVNEKFETHFSADDKLILNDLSRRLLDNSVLEGSIQNNTRDAAKIKFNEIFQQELINMLNGHFDLYKKLDGSVELKNYVNEKMFDFIIKKLKTKKGKE